MTDPEHLPAWPDAWLEDRGLAAEETVLQTGGVTLVSALRADDRVLMSVSWATGRRWLMVDPMGTDLPAALRIGEDPEDGETLRGLDALWSQALKIAKRIIDGDLPDPGQPPRPEAEKRRRWGRG